MIEIDPTISKIIWEYRDAVPFNFFSPQISGAQRLPNGNTLICEGNFGRLFEVNAAGEVVWEYVNPHFGVSPRFGLNNFVFRAFRYSAEEIERARGAQLASAFLALRGAVSTRRRRPASATTRNSAVRAGLSRSVHR